MKTKWKLINRKQAYSSKYVTVYEDEVKLPDGTVIPDYTVVKKPDIVMIVAKDENNILILQEYKYAVNETIYTLPAGHIKKEESAIETAQRELFEETGYIAEKYEEIGILYDYPSKDCHRVYIVLADNIHKKGKSTLDKTEQLNYILLPKKEILSQIQNKEWHSSSAIAALSISRVLR